MAGSGSFEVREAAALGFGIYDANQSFTAKGVGQANATFLSLPAGARFMLLATILFNDLPPDMVQYQVFRSNDLLTSLVATEPREPIYRFVSAEQGQIGIAAGPRLWAATYIPSVFGVNVELLYGGEKQLSRLLKWLGEGHAPASMIEDAADTFEGVLSAASGDYY